MSSQPKINRNPFAQPSAVWQLNFRVPHGFAAALEDHFEEGALAVSSFRDPEDANFWTVHVLQAEEPQRNLLEARLIHLATACGVPLPEWTTRRILPEDWQPSMKRDFPPLSLGRFYVHGAHMKDERPTHARPIQVEAGMAFGSGEHATTSGCLLAIDRLARQRAFFRVLDMGCGSAILAIAAARCFPHADFLAVDVDEVSVRVAQESIRLNGLHGKVRAITGDGYRDARVGQGAPYDLILANILARPLVEFSHQLARHIAEGGVAVLSGILVSQVSFVLAAHRRQGLKLKSKYEKDGWATLILSA